MIVFLNGKFIDESAASIPITDRGFLYGDAIFEAMRVVGQQPFQWDRHMARFRQGVKQLKLRPPYSEARLHRTALRLLELNHADHCILRLTLTRGSTGRTYSPRHAVDPVVLMTLHPLVAVTRMPRWRVVTSTLRLQVDDPLARFKSANKLVQVMARAEADAAGAREALLLNTADRLAEGTTSNVFWIKNGAVRTPPLTEGALPGVTRSLIFDLCAELKIKVVEQTAGLNDLSGSEGAFLTMTSMGVVEISSLDRRPLRRSPLSRTLWSAHRRLLQAVSR